MKQKRNHSVELFGGATEPIDFGCTHRQHAREQGVNVLRIAGYVVLLGIFTYVISYIARLPASNCSTKRISEHWSPDHAYKATLMEKNCNLGETIFYSVRVDANSPPLKRGWFVPGYELEDDEYPTAPPKLS